MKKKMKKSQFYVQKKKRKIKKKGNFIFVFFFMICSSKRTFSFFGDCSLFLCNLFFIFFFSLCRSFRLFPFSRNVHTVVSLMSLYFIVGFFFYYLNTYTQSRFMTILPFKNHSLQVVYADRFHIKCGPKSLSFLYSIGTTIAILLFSVAQTSPLAVSVRHNAYKFKGDIKKELYWASMSVLFIKKKKKFFFWHL